MTPEELFRALKPIQEKKGYFFNPNKELTLSLLVGLLTNKDRYGYLGCPCRLADGDRDWDRDIICPCLYREADVAEYGACYCGLYVAKDYDLPEPPAVPERRPGSKVR